MKRFIQTTVYMKSGKEHHFLTDYGKTKNELETIQNTIYDSYIESTKGGRGTLYFGLNFINASEIEMLKVTIRKTFLPRWLFNLIK